MRGRRGLLLLVALLVLLAPTLVAAAVWAPTVARNLVPAVAVDDQVIETARDAPSDAVMEAIARFDLLPIDGLDDQAKIAVADGLLEGRLELPGRSPSSIGLPFDPDDLDGVPASLRLWFAGYGVPDVLLSAYAQTGREEYFSLARDMILAWDGYERTAWQPHGFLWNDHATAARVRVLGEFWRLYRQRPDYSPEVGRVVLEQAARYRSILADPGRFTFATNHGVMQNLALLEVGALFPTLPDSERYEQLAMDRLDGQLSFLVDDQGVVRENSAGYQAFDMGLLGMTFRTMTILGRPIPAEWTAKYEAGLATLARLERPDGTLPALGDTDGVAEPAPDVVEVRGDSADPLQPRPARPPDQAVTLDPAAGYWIKWDGLANWPDPASLSQTLVTWTSPPSPSHKHADELSTLVWSKGVPWLTSVGYWPFDDPSFDEANAWSGSNAPHAPNEDPASLRTTRALASGSSDALSAIDLERHGPGGYVARRQVVHLAPDTWLIVDHVTSDPGTGNQTVWQLPADVTATPGTEPGSYSLESAGGATAQLTVLGSDGAHISDVSGSRDPFAGWQVLQSVPTPAPAIVVDQPPGEAWTAAVLTTSRGSPTDGTATMSNHTGADAWTITTPTAAGSTTVSWSDGAVTSERRDGSAVETANLGLAAVPDPSADVASLRVAFDNAAAAYPQYQERASARSKVTLVLPALALVQLVLLLLVRRVRPALLAPLGVVCAVAWIGLAAAMFLLVLPSWQVLAPT